MSDNHEDLYRVTPRMAKKFVLKALTAGLVPFLQSSPGMGKSSIMRAIAKELNLLLIDHRLSTSAPEDLSGLPRFNDQGHAVFAPFSGLFPLRGQALPLKKAAVIDEATGKVIAEAEYYDGWLVFLDEFNSATKLVQAAAYKLILDRMVGQEYLHDCVAVSAAGNLSTDRALVNPLGTAMQSRVVHIEMKISFDEWLMDVALPQKYDQRVIAYLSQHPGKLMDFRPDHQEKTFCCPRTWEFMERMVHGDDVTDEYTPLYAGTITSGTAASFVQFTKVYATMPKWQDILDDPDGHALPTDLNTKWAVVTSLLEHVTEKTLDKLATYVNRLDSTFQILFFRSVMVNNKELRQHPAFAKAMLSLAQYLRG